MSGFNLALTAVGEMLAKLTHLDRMPGGGGALAGLSLEVDGTDEAIRITWTQPDAARKAAAYGAALREALKAASPTSPPPADAPPPCERPDESAPPPLRHVAAAGDAGFIVPGKPFADLIDEPWPAIGEAISGAATARFEVRTPSAAEAAPETSGEDLSRVPPEAPASSPVEPPADSNRGRVLAAWRDGGRDVPTLSRASGLERNAVVMALKGLRSVGLIPKLSELRSPDRPGCAMREDELPGDAALRLREEGFGWEAIAKACGYKSADSAQMCASRWRAKHRPAPAAEPPPAAPSGPDLRTAKVDAVLGRIGIGAEPQDKVSKDASAAAPQAAVEAGQSDTEAGPASPAPPLEAPETAPQAEAAWDDAILVTVQERDDGRLDVAGPAGVHMASPAVGRMIARLAGGALLGAEALAPAAGVKPAEVPSLQSAVRLACNRVGRSLLVVKGIGWRITR